MGSFEVCDMDPKYVKILLNRWIFNLLQRKGEDLCVFFIAAIPDTSVGYSHFGKEKYVFPKILSAIIQDSIPRLELRDDDIWIGGFSRSGTHWLAEMTWLINTKLDFDRALSVEHEERILYFDFQPKAIQIHSSPDKEVLYDRHKNFFASLQSPRHMKTHLPLSLLPPSLLDKSKMVYIARDPRDVAVSLYHYYKNYDFTQFNGDFKLFWDLFKKGYCVYCPYFSNIKEFWEKRHHPNLLFMFYEDILNDLEGTSRRVTEFLGHSYTDEQIKKLTDHLDFKNMKKNKSVNYDQKLGKACNDVVRKGVAGGWRQEFDEEMARDAEAWIADNLRGTDLKFPMC